MPRGQTAQTESRSVPCAPLSLDVTPDGAPRHVWPGADNPLRKGAVVKFGGLRQPIDGGGRLLLTGSCWCDKTACLSKMVDRIVRSAAAYAMKALAE